MTLFFNQAIQPGELKRELLVFHLLWHVWIQEYARSFHKHHWGWGEAGPENPRCLSTSIRTHFHELSPPFREGPPALAIFHSCSGFLGPRDDGGTEGRGGVGLGEAGPSAHGLSRRRSLRSLKMADTVIHRSCSVIKANLHELC